MELPTEASANSSLGQASSARGQTPPSSGRHPRPAPRGMASYQRRRAVKACQVCRARRTKCDNLKPSCSFCLKTGAKCVQSPVDLSSFDPASLKILERLDDLEGLLRPASLDASGGPLHKRPAQEPESRRDAEATPTPVHMSMVLPGTVDEMLHWPCFQDLLPPEQQFPASMPARHDQPGPLPPSPASILGGLDLEPVRVNDLLNRFFSYVHVKNPILDERATRRAVQSTILNGADWSPESCLSFLICALGSIATPFGPSHDTMPGTPAYSIAVSLFQAAQKRIGALLFSDDIIAPQCLFLSGVFAMCIFQPVKAWRFFMQALAHCQQLDFLSKAAQQQHSYPKSPGGPCIQGPGLDSLHQAVYWSAWKSEREMRGYLHLTDFSPNDHGVNLYPAFFPTPPVPRVEDDAAPIDVDQQREQTSWYFYLAEISLRRLAARMGDEIEVMQRAHPTRLPFLHAVALAVPAYEAQIQEWIDSLPPRLSFAAPAEHDDVCRFVLRGHAINFFEMLYWPFLSAYLDTSALDATALTPFTDLAQKALDHHVLRLTVNEPGYRHRHHGTYPMMQSCSRSALALVAAAAYNRRALLGGAGRGRCCPLTMPLGWIQSVSTLIGLLDFWSREVRSLDVIRRLLERGLLAVMN